MNHRSIHTFETCAELYTSIHAFLQSLNFCNRWIISKFILLKRLPNPIQAFTRFWKVWISVTCESYANSYFSNLYRTLYKHSLVFEKYESCRNSYFSKTSECLYRVRHKFQKYELTYDALVTEIHTFQKRVNACIEFGRGFKHMNLHMIHLFQNFILFKNEWMLV